MNFQFNPVGILVGGLALFLVTTSGVFERSKIEGPSLEEGGCTH